MKYWGISYGKIIEGFSVFPSVSVSWATLKVKDKLPGNYNRYYDIQFSWFFWYVTFGQLKNKLKEEGYY